LISEQEAKHLNLLRTDEDYKAWGIKWMKEEGKEMEEMPAFWV